MNISRRVTTAITAVMLAALTACAPSAKRESAGEYIDDTAITAKVKAAFATDPQVKATQVQVETYKGTVQLSGFVDSKESSRRAVELARQVHGVKDVKNDTVVR